MRRHGIMLSFLVVVLVATPWLAYAQDDPMVLVFYREGCNDCERVDRVLQELHTTYASLTIRYIEEGGPDGDLMWALSANYGIFPSKFPVIFVGNEAIVGVGLDKELRLRAAIEGCMRFGCESPLVRVIGPQIPWRAYIVAGLIAVLLLLIFIDYAI